MAPGLRQHLSDEIQSLLSMRPYDGEALLKVYKDCEAEAGKQDKVRSQTDIPSSTPLSYYSSLLI